MRCLHFIRRKYKPKRVPKEKRVQLRKISESNESSNEESVTNDNDDAMNGLLCDDDLQNVDSVQNDARQMNPSANDETHNCLESPTEQTQAPTLNTMQRSENTPEIELRNRNLRSRIEQGKYFN